MVAEIKRYGCEERIRAAPENLYRVHLARFRIHANHVPRGVFHVARAAEPFAVRRGEKLLVDAVARHLAHRSASGGIDDAVTLPAEAGK